MKRTVYLSIPITGKNFETVKEKALAAKKYLKTIGFSVINPVELAAELERKLGREAAYGEYMGIDLMYLIDCADAVYFCKDWQNSKGCMLEFAAAKIYEKEMIFSPLNPPQGDFKKG
jgi:hypothetical protein